MPEVCTQRLNQKYRIDWCWIENFKNRHLDFYRFVSQDDTIGDFGDSSFGDDGYFGDVAVDVFKVRLNTSFESQHLIAVWLNGNP